MKPSEIEVGKTYRNRGAGRTKRRVVAIHPPGSEACNRTPWSSNNQRHYEEAVEYEQQGVGTRLLFISSFATWAGSVVEEKPN